MTEMRFKHIIDGDCTREEYFNKLHNLMRATKDGDEITVVRSKDGRSFCVVLFENGEYVDYVENYLTIDKAYDCVKRYLINHKSTGFFLDDKVRKITEHTYGTKIFMRLIVDGRIEEVTNRCGFDCTWSIYETSADNDEERRRRIIEAFDELY